MMPPPGLGFDGPPGMPPMGDDMPPMEDDMPPMMGGGGGKKIKTEN